MKEGNNVSGESDSKKDREKRKRASQRPFQISCKKSGTDELLP